MNNNIEQLLSLISYGNQYLIKQQTSKLIDTVLYKGYRTLTFNFMEKNLFKNKLIAQNPIQWFQYLGQRNCLKLELVHEPKEAKDFRSVSLCGGGKGWYIKAIFNNYDELWDNNCIDERDSNKSYIKYTRLKRKKIAQPENSIESASKQLVEALVQIKQLAFNWELTYWEGLFAKTIKILKSDQAQFINDQFDHSLTDLILKENYPFESIRMLVAANKMFIFSGWDSWNELDWWGEHSKFLDEKYLSKYRTFSENLYKTRNLAIASCINHDNLKV